MFQVLRIRDFRLLWSGGAVSSLGSWLLVLGIPAHVFAVTGSLTATGFTLAAEYVPVLVLGPVAGVVADRWDRRRVMIGADLFRAAVVAGMLAGTSAGRYWVLYVALAAESGGSALFEPALQARTPEIVGTGSLLNGANALNAATAGVVRLIGGPLGGLLLAVAGVRVLIGADAASYLVSAAALMMTSRLAGRDSDQAADPEADRSGGRQAGQSGGRQADRSGGRQAGQSGGRQVGRSGTRPTGQSGGRSGQSGGRQAGQSGGRSGQSGTRLTGDGTTAAALGRDLAEGLGELRRQPVARALLLVTSIFLAANAGLSAVIIPFGVERLGGSSQTGLVFAALGAGFLLGAPALGILLGAVQPRYLLTGALAGTAVSYWLLFRSADLAAALPAAVAVGLLGSMSLVIPQTTAQRIIPGAALGRIMAAFLTGEAAATLAGAVIGPVVAQAAGLAGAATAASAVTLAAAALAWLLIPANPGPAHPRPTSARTARPTAADPGPARPTAP
jgi:predicted MFS family arabinose efflux permease